MTDKFPIHSFGDKICKNIQSGLRSTHKFLWNIWVIMDFYQRTCGYHKEQCFHKSRIAWTDKYYCWCQWLPLVFNKVLYIYLYICVQVYIFVDASANCPISFIHDFAALILMEMNHFFSMELRLLCT